MSNIKSALPSIQLNKSRNILKIECSNISNEISTVINHIQNAGGLIEDIDTRKVNLESVFLKLTGKQLRD